MSDLTEGEVEDLLRHIQSDVRLFASRLANRIPIGIVLNMVRDITARRAFRALGKPAPYHAPDDVLRTMSALDTIKEALPRGFYELGGTATIAELRELFRGRSPPR